MKKVNMKLIKKYCLALAMLYTTIAFAQSNFANQYKFEQTYLQITANAGKQSDKTPYGVLKIADKYKLIFWYAVKDGQLSIFSNDKSQLKRIKTYNFTIGKWGYNKLREGDNRTPLGIYFYQKFIPDSELNDFYGLGAYPIDYPNPFDRFRKRSGYGIWLHGYPKDVDFRPLRDSRGCMVVTNAYFAELQSLIDNNESIVILQEDFMLGNSKKTAKLKKQVTKKLTKWNRSWNARKKTAFFKFYSDQFKRTEDDNRDYLQNLSDAMVNQHTKFKISEVTALLYPTTDDVIFVEFTKTQNKKSEVIQQYWHFLPKQNQWQIFYEGVKKVS